MRTVAGYIFKCKTCGNYHVMATKGEPFDGILMDCAFEERAIRKYEKEDFSFYHGWANGIVGEASEVKR